MRVEMPSADGKIRLLAVPTMVDRFVQQAIVQVVRSAMEKRIARAFSPNIRSNRIVRELDVLLKKGDRWVFPPKIERFFDKTPHDQLGCTLGAPPA
jgi:RNA-directed DNA polymerase